MATGDMFNHVHLFVKSEFPQSVIEDLCRACPIGATLSLTPRFHQPQGKIYSINCIKTLPVKDVVEVIAEFCKNNKIELIKE